MTEAEPPRSIRAKATEVHGSNAGAGSGTLALYRKHRRIELDRVEKLDALQREEERNVKIQQELAEKNAQLQARTEKNRKSRNRKRQKREVEPEE